MKWYKIAIDGPAGVGKSTLAKEIANKLGFIYVDSGAMFRAVGLFCKNNNIDVSDHNAVIKALDNIEIEYNNKQCIYLNGEDVTLKIRTSEVSKYASFVAVIREVREKLLHIQRKISESKNVIMDGRDIGTKVFPDADVKIFLTADCKERAKRRYNELKSTNNNITYEEILKEIEFRDKNDSTRKINPLKPAKDAIILDNTNLTLKETIEKAIEIIRGKIK